MHSVDRTLFWRIVASISLTLGLGALVAVYVSGSVPLRLTSHAPATLWLGLNFLTVSACAPVAFAVSAYSRLSGREQARLLALPAACGSLAICLCIMTALWIDLPNAYRIFAPDVLLSPRSTLFPVPWCVFSACALMAAELRISACRASRYTRIYALAAGAISAVALLLSLELQGRLGGMFRVAGTRLNPLWHSPQQPLLFTLSAVAGGCALAIFSNEMWRRAGGAGIGAELLGTIARAMGLFGALFAATRVWDIAHNQRLAGALRVLRPGSEAENLFWLEIGLTVLAVVIVLHPARRDHPESLFSASVMTLGVLMAHRINLSVGIQSLPTAAEAAVSAALLAAGALAFYMLLRIQSRPGTFQSDTAQGTSERFQYT